MKYNLRFKYTNVDGEIVEFKKSFNKRVYNDLVLFLKNHYNATIVFEDLYVGINFHPQASDSYMRRMIKDCYNDVDELNI